MELIDSKYVYGVLQEIVNKVHTDPQKKHVRIKADKISYQISCVYCGDSQTNPRNYRGNLNSILFYKCFNCGKQTHFTSMCKDFGIEIDVDTKLRIYEYLDKQIDYKAYKEDFNSMDLSHLINLSDLQRCINLNECVSPLMNFEPIQPKSRQEFYLLNRGITPDMWKNIYQANIYVNENKTEPVIVFLNRKEDKILGMQCRNLKDNKGRFFHIYNFKDLYDWIGNSELSEEELIVYNKLSYFYNILNISFEQKITIFEGYLDSLYYPNSVGLVGTNTDYSFFLDNNLDIQFFFDNDQTGFNKSNELIEDGHIIFLWNKLFEDIVKKKNVYDPYTLENKIKKVKDLNRLGAIINNPYQKLELYNFFSKDLFDKVYLPPKKKFKLNYKKKITN